MKRGLALFLAMLMLVSSSNVSYAMESLSANQIAEETIIQEEIVIEGKEAAAIAVENLTFTYEVVQKKDANNEIVKDDEGNIVEVAKITGCNGSVSKLEIPSEIDGYTVEIIGSKAFAEGMFTEVVMPDTILSIEHEAFNKCGSLENITFSKSLMKMGEFAFGNCNSLTKVTIPASLDNGGKFSYTGPDGTYKKNWGAFNGCLNLKTIEFEEGTTKIASYLCANLDNLESITIPATVEEIDTNAFYNCDKLVSVVFSEDSNLTLIGSYAFEDCDLLETIVIPDSVTRINNYAFSECDILKEVQLSKVQALGGGAFYNCDSLESIKIPKTLISTPTSVTIGATQAKFIFSECDNLKTITFEDGITEIADGLFYKCQSLESIEIPDTVTLIGSKAFYNCTALATVKMPSALQKIESKAFGNCAALTEITLAETASSVSADVFDGIEKLVIYGYAGTRAEELANSDTTKYTFVDLTIPDEELVPYYSSWNEAYEALKSYCGIADASNYTVEQVNFINAFLDKWPDILYGATDEDEANSLLKKAKAEFDALPLDDEEALKEYAKFVAEREKVFNEKMAIMEANIADAKYTGDSRFEYETAAREALGTILNASDYDVLNSGIKAFEDCVSLLEEVSPELKAAQDAAKSELATILANEYENITTIDDYYSRIDNCNNEDEIASVVEDCKEYMLACVNANIATYRNIKLTKTADYCRTFESELGIEKFNELKTYYRNNMGTLSGAANKVDVDSAYNDLLILLASKVEELLSGGGILPEDVAVTGVSLNKTELTLEVAAEDQLAATVTPDDATDKTVTWTTSNSSVVTVNNGKVVAVKAGTAVVTAKAGEFEATCTVTVIQPVTQIALNKTSATLSALTKTLQLNATVSPTNANNRNVVWSSSNSTVASVSSKGLVTAKTVGTAVITAKAADGSGVKAVCKITVKPVLKGESYTVSGVKYKISDASTDGTGTVAVTGASKKTITSLSVPKTVKINNVSFKVTEIADSAFKGYTKLKKVSVGSNVVTINQKAFYGCTALSSVTGCSNVKTLGNYAFYSCKKLTRIGSSSGKVTLPAVVKIGSYAFKNCIAMKYVNLSSKNLTSIGSSAFYGCTALKTVVISSTKLTTIGSKCFYKCKSLSALTIKSSKLTKSKVGSSAFKGIKSTCTFKVPKSKISSYKSIFKAKGAGSKIAVKKY